MDLTHSFTVPASLADTWRTFEDIESVAGCFPGAVVTEVDGNDFKGTCKVKLGPIAMVYSGTGTFLEKDESAGRFVVDAKGKDKRGNGTAGAVVTATFTEEGPTSTRVDVATDLAITGKPAQFGRGVIEDISNKLLQQFVTCLQDKVAPSSIDDLPEPGAEAPNPSEAGPLGTGPVGAGPMETAGAAGTPGTPGTTESAGVAGTVTPPPVTAPAAAGPSAASVGTGGTAATRTPPRSAQGPEVDDALDLGATVIPILARTYGPQVGIAMGALLVGWLLGRRSR